jgi:hypothetical protein
MTRATTTGVVGAPWRATVTDRGIIEPWDGSARLEWCIAADDRWHRPAIEAAVRQQHLEGTPVVETRVRIPSGDAVQRIYSVPDHGGCTVMEVTNDSPMPIAVAFTRGDLLTSRPPATMPIEGIDLPAGSFVLPVGHRSSVAVALSHSGRTGALDAVPPAAQVARGWTVQLDRAGRVLSPDAEMNATLARCRAELLLCGPEGDALSMVLGITQLARLGEPCDPWLEHLGACAEELAASLRGSAHLTTLQRRALLATIAFFEAAGQRRAADDATRILLRMPAATVPESRPDGIGAAGAAWIEDRLVRLESPDTALLLGDGMPGAWRGSNFEVYALPAGTGAAVSYAVRWHGERPAALWEVHGQRCVLRAPGGWSTIEASGETLWPADV